MARSSTRAALSSGSVIGMMGILMKLRKVCAHDLVGCQEFRSDGYYLISPACNNGMRVIFT